ncbi:hypothetical protein JKP88DRAFT_261702 [Tribonema minus]|uniref:Uncharacterized protein n=1 Tax=Tribonema minus TaxID=303371 RepID=A0A836CPE7_9STRA|nr:hypothetical protein JKP88DRAFT_261702 [Tribonema minus]
MYHRQKETLLPSVGWSAGHYANASHKRKLSTAFMASVAWLLLSGVFMAIGYFYCKTLQQKVAVICDSAACIIAKEKNGEIFKHDLLRTSLLRGELLERFNAIKDAVKRAKLEQLSLNAAAEDVPIGRGQRRLLIASWDLGSGKARDGLRAFERYLLKYDGHADALLLEERHFWRTSGVCFVIIGALNFVGALLLGSLREPFAKAGKRH